MDIKNLPLEGARPYLPTIKHAMVSANGKVPLNVKIREMNQITWHSIWQGISEIRKH